MTAKMQTEIPTCKCGCGQTAKRIPGGWTKYAPGHYTKRGASNPNFREGQAIYQDSPNDTPPICKCGCGEPTYWLTTGRRWARYNKGHYTKDGSLNPRYQGGRTREKQPEGELPPLCKCGCDNPVTWNSGNGRWHKYIEGHYTKQGSQSPNWKGGYVDNKLERYDYNWVHISKQYRESVGWKCEDCGIDFSEQIDLLHAHHIDLNSKNCDFSNLRALCYICHGKYHGRTWVGGPQPNVQPTT